MELETVFCIIFASILIIDLFFLIIYIFKNVFRQRKAMIIELKLRCARKINFGIVSRLDRIFRFFYR